MGKPEHIAFVAICIHTHTWTSSIWT